MLKYQKYNHTEVMEAWLECLQWLNSNGDMSVAIIVRPKNSSSDNLARGLKGIIKRSRWDLTIKEEKGLVFIIRK